jgi:cbb3-type cytochrome oxidase subunit 3
MFNRLLDKVVGADIWMVLSFSIFFLFFLFVTIYLWKSDKGHIKRMSEMPVNDEAINNNTEVI